MATTGLFVDDMLICELSLDIPLGGDLTIDCTLFSSLVTLLVPLMAAVGLGILVLCGICVFCTGKPLPDLFDTSVLLTDTFTLGSASLEADKLATLFACFSTSVLVVFGPTTSFLPALGLFLDEEEAFAGLEGLIREAFRTGFTSTLGSKLALLSLLSLRADDTPLELLVRLPLLTGAGLSLDLNSLSLSSMEFFCCWGFC